MEDIQQVRNNFVKQNACVLIPTYNNDKTLLQVVKDVLKFTDRVIVVNDGSTDNTSQILLQFPGITVITLPENKGKGIALRTGFKSALEKKFKYAITMDSDGQHFAEDLGLFLEKINREPRSIIIGARNMEQEGIPGGSSFGHKFSNFWFWIETGLKMPDTQCGFRLYPLKEINDLEFFTPRFEFEIEVIVKAAWKGVHVTSVPVKVFYAKGGERVSHFRKKTDFARISLLNTWFVILAIAWYHPKRFLQKLKWKNLKHDIKKNMYDPSESPARKSCAVALGVMMGILPIWGYQLIAAIALAFIFRLNKVIAAIATNISFPPLIPFILYGSIKTGEMVTGKKADILFSSGLTLEAIKKNMFIYVTASIVLAAIVSILCGLLTFLVLNASEKKAAKA